MKKPKGAILRKLPRILAWGVPAVAVVSLAVLHYGVLPHVDATMNALDRLARAPVSAWARTFHDAAFVADLHADPLLWGRELRTWQTRGHADLARLRAGGVDLQVFGVVTKVPRGRNYAANPGDSDSLPLLFLASWRSPRTWFDPKERALAQAEELRRLADAPDFTLVLKAGDLEAPELKGLLALEGMHALGGDGDAVTELHAAGFRMMGLAHFFDNAVAGSAHGTEKYGLTAFGRAQILRLEALGITIDLAHASRAAVDDTLDIATKPVVVSHSGVQGTCPGPRNLSDHHLRRIAENGGVVGIGYWAGAVCDSSLKGIVAAIAHAISVAGVAHVGLGSDFDGAVAMPFDTSELAALTEALLNTGMTETDLKKVLGGNVRRVLAGNLPR